MNPDRYWSASEIILSTDCYCGRYFCQCIIRNTKCRSIFWQSIEFEATYLQRLQKLIFSTAAIACYPPLSAVWRTTNSGPGFRHVWAYYCNSLLVGLSTCDISRLKSVQNAAGRLFGGVSRFDSVDHVLRDDLHWLPVKQIIIFKVGMFGYKAIHGLAPSYLKDLFVLMSSVPALSRNRSVFRWDFIIPSATRNITYRQRSFAVAGPTWWNYFPWKSATPVPY